mmetsp:Transcript_41984/g.70983  ORF Transcript_41984/g.70983 Transcript_41984/m.70983 type:complete len:206 (-) Transcript_41984:414-1031(-)
MAWPAPPNSRRASSCPAWIATGVSCGRPAATSPIAKMWAALVRSSASVTTNPSPSTRTPARSSPMPLVHGRRPVANSTVSHTSVPGAPPSLRYGTRLRPVSGSRVTSSGTAGRRTRTPVPSRPRSTRSAMSWSNPRSGIERIMTATLWPSPRRKPAHSSATYDPPTTRTSPGSSGSWKMSSLVMPCSVAPGMSGYAGRPPIASTK